MPHAILRSHPLKACRKTWWLPEAFSTHLNSFTSPRGGVHLSRQAQTCYMDIESAILSWWEESGFNNLLITQMSSVVQHSSADTMMTKKYLCFLPWPPLLRLRDETQVLFGWTQPRYSSRGALIVIPDFSLPPESFWNSPRGRWQLGAITATKLDIY